MIPTTKHEIMFTLPKSFVQIEAKSLFLIKTSFDKQVCSEHATYFLYKCFYVWWTKRIFYFKYFNLMEHRLKCMFCGSNPKTKSIASLRWSNQTNTNIKSISRVFFFFFFFEKHKQNWHVALRQAIYKLKMFNSCFQYKSNRNVNRKTSTKFCIIQRVACVWMCLHAVVPVQLHLSVAGAGVKLFQFVPFDVLFAVIFNKIYILLHQCTLCANAS